MRVNAKTGIRAGPEDKDAITEYFKPFEEPDDAYSVIGVTSDGGAAFSPMEPDQAVAQRRLSSGRGLQ